MQTLLILVLVIIFPALAAGQESSPESRSSAFELSTELTVSVLPEPLRSYYAREIAELRASVGKIDETVVSRRPTLPLDAAAVSSDRRSRLEAVRKFPRAAANLEGSPLLTDAIEEQVRLLREALSMDESRAALIDRTATLIRLTTETALPFNTTCGAHFGASDAERFLFEHRARFHELLIGRRRNRLKVELRIDPSRVKPTNKTEEAVLEASREAYRWIDPLLEIEASVAAEMVAKPGEELKKHEERFLDELAERAYPILEARIEAGALLAAHLIVGAWMDAGKPAVQVEDESVVGAAPPEAPVNAEPAKSPALLGSKDSTVFHRADCVHLARVKPENRVSFEDAKSAVAKGRKPCKSCKPDAAIPANVAP